ncbi:MAG: ABC transporter ATP-binding protein [Chitinophagales bacterium]|nr:ABC transporter ATP-binding protein [Chitinophagales bacterium]
MQKHAFGILSLQGILKEYYSNTGSVIKALNHVSLTINKGDFVVVIGKNGCGKSTLLKTISGIIKPTKGQIELFGTLTSINELGSGVEPEISGYDNIKMIGRLNRLTATQLSKLRQFVEDFSELGERLNEPVKSYSQGMYLRLAFSINAFLETDILVFDEILAVGDIRFRKKCFSLLETAAGKGKTIIIATHNFEEIGNLCTRCIWLNEGKVEMDGNADDVYQAYLRFLNANEVTAPPTPTFKNLQPDLVELQKMYVTQNHEATTNLAFWKKTEIVVEWIKGSEPYGVTFTVFISNALNRAVILSMSDNYGLARESVKAISTAPPGVYREIITLPEGLLNLGTYSIYLSASYFTNDHNDEIVSHTVHPLVFTVEDDTVLHETHIWKYTQAPIRITNTFTRNFVDSLAANERVV